MIDQCETGINLKNTLEMLCNIGAGVHTAWGWCPKLLHHFQPTLSTTMIFGKCIKLTGSCSQELVTFSPRISIIQQNIKQGLSGNWLNIIFRIYRVCFHISNAGCEIQWYVIPWSHLGHCFTGSGKQKQPRSLFLSNGQEHQCFLWAHGKKSLLTKWSHW